VLEAPKSLVTPELLASLSAHKAELLRLLSAPAVEPKLTLGLFPAAGGNAEEVTAVKLSNTVIGDVWLVADREAAAENPDILGSGLPVFFFDEVEHLRGKTVEELRAIGRIKVTFPTSRLLQ